MSFLRQPVMAIRQSLSDRDRRNLYPPLKGPKCTRLLRILPGESSDIIRVTLEEVSLPDADGAYNALSYCWLSVKSPLAQGYHVTIDFRSVGPQKLPFAMRYAHVLSRPCHY